MAFATQRERVIARAVHSAKDRVKRGQWSTASNDGKGEGRMADPQKSPDGSQTALGSSDELGTVWNHFRSGGAVPCPIDRAPLALAVDASAGLYRFVCTQCGAASAWFESGPAGLRVRGNLADQS
jgi:hypothetical protein